MECTPFYRWVNWGTQRLCNWPREQLVSGTKGLRSGRPESVSELSISPLASQLALCVFCWPWRNIPYIFYKVKCIFWKWDQIPNFVQLPLFTPQHVRTFVISIYENLMLWKLLSILLCGPLAQRMCAFVGISRWPSQSALPKSALPTGSQRTHSHCPSLLISLLESR